MTQSEAIASGWQERVSELGLARPSELLDRSPADGWPRGTWTELGKPGLGGRQRWRGTVDGLGQIYLKRYESTPFREQIDRMRRQAPRHSRAWWEFHVSEQLWQAHIGAPRAIAVAEQMQGTFEQRSAVLLTGVEGDALDRVWTKATIEGWAATRGWPRRDLVIRLGRFVSAFHGTGLCHRDLYLCHVFIQLDPDYRRPPELSIIDLARAHMPRLRRMRWVLKDLAQLDVSARQIGWSRTDRFRCLLAYLGLQPGSMRARWYASRVARWSGRILRRIQRKERPAGSAVASSVSVAQ